MARDGMEWNGILGLMFSSLAYTYMKLWGRSTDKIRLEEVSAKSGSDITALDTSSIPFCPLFGCQKSQASWVLTALQCFRGCVTWPILHCLFSAKFRHTKLLFFCEKWQIQLLLLRRNLQSSCEGFIPHCLPHQSIISLHPPLDFSDFRWWTTVEKIGI